MDRRSFLNLVGVGILANSLSAVIVACSDSQTQSEAADVNPETNSKVAKRDNFQIIGTASELERQGFILKEDIAGKPVMVFRHPESGELIAVNSKCTHQKCNIVLDTKTNILVCPCHDSHFALNGEVVKGPAKKPLDVYKVEQNGYLILVNLG